MAKTVKHSSRAHALLSASGANRWMNCTPSARLEEKHTLEALAAGMKPAPESVFAKEGTLAHEFGEVKLRHRKGDLTKAAFNKQIKKLESNELFTPEMHSEVDKYADYVMEQFSLAKTVTKDAVLVIEERLDFSHIVKNGFGTGDANIIADGVLEVIDLKYGKGVPVYSENNPQLMLYGLGALRRFELMYDIDTVRLTIVQPRLNNISSQEISVTKLEYWGNNIIKPAAEKAYAGEGTKRSGDWCRWCTVKAQCPAIAKANMEMAKHDFKEPDLLSDDEILDVYNQIDSLQDWAKSVSEYILETALHGKKWAGLKVVEGRRQRKWSDDNKVIETLKENGYSESQYMISKLAGIPAMEKLLGKPSFSDVLGTFVDLPAGKPTLAPESDKRPAMGVEQAQKDFK